MSLPVATKPATLSTPPLSTPADEWAAKTTDEAFQPHDERAPFVLPSADSTPGTELPGAFPRSALDRLSDAAEPKPLSETVQQYVPDKETVNAHVETAKTYLPAQETVNGHVETAKSYLPAQEDVQRALGNAGATAKQYIPQGVVDAVAGILPAGLTSASTTTPPASSHPDLEKTAVPDQQSSFSKELRNSTGEGEDSVTSGAAPLSNMGGLVGGVGVAAGKAFSAVTPTTGVTPSNEPPEAPYVDTSNIQVPYSATSNDSAATEKSVEPHRVGGDEDVQRTNAALRDLKIGPDSVEPRPHPITDDSSIQRTNAALQNMQSGPSDIQPRPHPIEKDSGIGRTNKALNNLQSGPSDLEPSKAASSTPVIKSTVAPTPPAKDDVDAELINTKGSGSAPYLNTDPTHDHILDGTGKDSGHGSSVPINTQLGQQESPTRSSSEGNSSDDAHDGHKKKKGSFLKKMKDKLHVGHHH